MNIGSITLRHPVILAPMAGVCDLPFRVLAKSLGCALVVAEMVSDKGLIYKNQHTHEMLAIEQSERPISIQIFGSDPFCMAKAARIVEQAGADIIDINMGCPTPKIVKNGEGSALMRTPELAYKIIAAVVDAVQIPVTVKMRKGWDESSVNAPVIAKLAEQAGAAAVAVHGRTREQFYSGVADLEIIKQVKNSVTIPVIGNGDIRCPEDAYQMMAHTGCDGVMIGRAAQGNPWIFAQINYFLDTGTKLSQPTTTEKIALLKRHLELVLQFKGEYIGIREMRKHAAWYTKGLSGSAKLRCQFNQAESKKAFLAVINRFEQQQL
jgi:tRNA-dihydrouridine synthase B